MSNSRRRRSRLTRTPRAAPPHLSSVRTEAIPRTAARVRPRNHAHAHPHHLDRPAPARASRAGRLRLDASIAAAETAVVAAQLVAADLVEPLAGEALLAGAATAGTVRLDRDAQALFLRPRRGRALGNLPAWHSGAALRVDPLGRPAEVHQGEPVRAGPDEAARCGAARGVPRLARRSAAGREPLARRQ